MLSFSADRTTLAAYGLAACGLLALLLPGAAQAQAAPSRPAAETASFPNRDQLEGMTVAGSYLAARHASLQRAAAAAGTAAH